MWTKHTLHIKKYDELNALFTPKEDFCNFCFFPCSWKIYLYQFNCTTILHKRSFSSFHRNKNNDIQWHEPNSIAYEITYESKIRYEWQPCAMFCWSTGRPFAKSLIYRRWDWQVDKRPWSGVAAHKKYRIQCLMQTFHRKLHIAITVVKLTLFLSKLEMVTVASVGN